MEYDSARKKKINAIYRNNLKQPCINLEQLSKWSTSEDETDINELFYKSKKQAQS